MAPLSLGALLSLVVLKIYLLWLEPKEGPKERNWGEAGAAGAGAGAGAGMSTQERILQEAMG